MGISSVTETPQVPAAPAPAAPVAASAPVAAPATSATSEPKQEQEAAPVSTPAPPPPPPPAKGYDMEVAVAEHAGTGHTVYGFLDPDSGEVVVQIPIDNVLNMVAEIVAKLKAEGRA